ncbi:MAG: hypothetical protein ACRC6U_10055, partial [Fusobacteriaceae bacterium]
MFFYVHTIFLNENSLEEYRVSKFNCVSEALSYKNLYNKDSKVISFIATRASKLKTYFTNGITLIDTLKYNYTLYDNDKKPFFLFNRKILVKVCELCFLNDKNNN